MTSYQAVILLRWASRETPSSAWPGVETRTYAIAGCVLVGVVLRAMVCAFSLRVYNIITVIYYISEYEEKARRKCNAVSLKVRDCHQRFPSHPLANAPWTSLSLIV